MPIADRILVTGGAGFIGSHLIDKVLPEGYEVVILDNLSTGKLSNIRQHLENKNMKFIRGDITDPSIVKKSLVGCNAVVHLASSTDVIQSFENPLLVNHVNVSGTLNLLKEALANDIKKFVFASSSAVYGDSLPPWKEDMIARPISPYGVSKLAAEHYCLIFAKTYRLPVIILRFFNVYGKRMKSANEASVISSFIEKIRNKQTVTIYGDGKQTRDFLHVNDAVDAILLAMQNNDCINEIYNIGTGKPASINHLFDILKNITGVNVKVRRVKARRGEIRHSYANISKARKELHYRPKFVLKSGLRDLLT